ncbi:hypothetical protein VTO73DRAFT_13805 [Trametes versicolor]
MRQEELDRNLACSPAANYR